MTTTRISDAQKRSLAMVTPRFKLADVEVASDAWGCNCGPTALATMCRLTLDEAHALIEGFDAKHYTNPTMMRAALTRLGRPWRETPQATVVAGAMPSWGLCRIQWQGPWCAPGVPPAAAYRHTHWIGVAKTEFDIGVWDVNAMAMTQDWRGWVSIADWSSWVAPAITSEIKRATGAWHVTHSIEVSP